MFVYRDDKGKILDVTGSVNVAELEALEKGEPSAAVEVVPAEDDTPEPEPEGEPDEESEPEPEPEEPEPQQESGSGAPKVADNKATWVDWAVSQGVDRDEAESLTKQELVDLYGD